MKYKILSYEQAEKAFIEQADFIEVLGYEYNEAELLQKIDPIAFKEQVLVFIDLSIDYKLEY